MLALTLYIPVKKNKSPMKKSETEKEKPTEAEEVKVKVAGVFIANTPDVQSPVVFLEAEDKVLPIYIGSSEAFSIQTCLDKRPYPRPLTHDLMVSVIHGLGVKIERIVIDDLNDGVYFSRLIMKKNGNTVEFDARPSDCIALAVRVEAPVYVSRKVLALAAVSKSEYEMK